MGMLLHALHGGNTTQNRLTKMHFSFSFEIYSLWDDLQANVLFREYILLTHLPVTIVFF